MPRGHVKGLDGLRGFAALLVFAEHQLWPGNWMLLGRLGVELFFVLSGFLIVGILTDRARRVEVGQASRWSEVKRFFVHRAFRIFPPYYVLLAGAALLAALGLMTVSLNLYPAYLTYTTNLYFAHWLGDWPSEQNFGHFWTLAVEEQFYLLAAPLFLCFAPRRHRLICLLLIALAAASMAAMIALGLPWFSIRVTSLVCFGYLAMGGLISQTLAPRPGRDSSVPALALMGAMFVAIGCFFLRPEGGLRFSTNVIYGVMSALIIAGVVANQESRFTRWFETRPLRAMGRISYAFYLYHLLVKLPHTGIAFAGMDLSILGNFLVTLALAWASWVVIEKPALALRDRLVADRRPAQPARPASLSPAASP